MLSRFFLIVVVVIFTSCVYHDLAPTVKCSATENRWEIEVKPIIVTYCALNGCHNGVTKPDFRIYEKAKEYAISIKTKTQDRSMPFDDTLTQDQIDAIACWVDDGAPEN